MNVYKNLLFKIRALLKEDDNLTKEQSELFQWQLLVKIEEYTFSVGKGGVNTIFYSASSTAREVCYPDEMLAKLENLSKRPKVFVYVAYSKKKELLVYSEDREVAKAAPGAHYLRAILFSGKSVPVEKRASGLFDGEGWIVVRKVT